MLGEVGADLARFSCIAVEASEDTRNVVSLSCKARLLFSFRHDVRRRWQESGREETKRWEVGSKLGQDHQQTNKHKN